ncbi:MAG: hypothetical protein AB1656_00780 [Candidatus Omnitrophota bacterium]
MIIPVSHRERRERENSADLSLLRLSSRSRQSIRFAKQNAAKDIYSIYYTPFQNIQEILFSKFRKIRASALSPPCA